MKKRVSLLLVCSLLLSAFIVTGFIGCQSKEKEKMETEVSESASSKASVPTSQDSSPRKVAEDTENTEDQKATTTEDTPSPFHSLAYYPAKPSVEEISQTDYWYSNYLPLLLYGYQPNYTRGDTVAAYNGVYLYIPARLAQDKQLKKYPRDKGATSISMPLEEYFLYAEKFFGEVNAPKDLETQKKLYDFITFEDKIDWEKETISLLMPAGYNPVRNTYDPAANQEYTGTRKITQIVPYTENDMDKVQLTLERYETNAQEVLDRLETYVFYWDDEVGFQVESSQWEWPETQVVELSGEAALFETLWGNTPSDFSLYRSAVEASPVIVSLGQELAMFSKTDHQLFCSFLNPNTLEQRENILVHEFDEETIDRLDFFHHQLYVYTDKAAYLFSEELSLVLQVDWPDSIKPYSSTAILSNDGSKVAYIKDSDLYSTLLQPDAEPVLLLKAYESGTAIVEYTYPFPLVYLEDHRLVAGLSAWESVGGFVLFSQKGDVLKEFPYSVSGQHSGGYALLDKQGLMVSPMAASAEETALYYYNFSSNTLETIDWMSPTKFYYASNVLPSNTEPMVYYIATGGFPDQESSTFLKLDVKNKKVEELPFSIAGTNMILLGVGPKDELLFSYSYKAEQQFGIFHPEVKK